MAVEPGSPDVRVARRVGLGVIAFGATLALLFGLGSLIGTSPTGSTGPSASGATGASVSTPSATISSATTPSSGPSSEPSTPPATEPGPTDGPDAVLVGAGDIADCGSKDDSATADLVAGIPGTVFTAGDNAYPAGSSAQFTDCYDPTWGRFRDRTRPAPGNHDHLTPDLAGYLAYFGDAASPDGTTWYSYDLGTWHIIVLDSSCAVAGGCGPDSAQGRWLAGDLAASDAGCTMAIWHHPRWSSGNHGSDPTVAPFWRALYDADADVVVNGHDHDYERFTAQDPGGHADADRGLREFVVGTGGADLRPFGKTVANSDLRVAGIHGVIRFDLQPSGYRWQFISTTGELTDTGQGACH
jgi:Calcineurin-like phosphoesterase